MGLLLRRRGRGRGAVCIGHRRSRHVNDPLQMRPLGNEGFVHGRLHSTRKAPHFGSLARRNGGYGDRAGGAP